MTATSFRGAFASLGTRRVGPWTAALAAGAVLQIVVPLTGAERIGAVADANATRITPAGWAFTIWTPIFVLALVWAGWRLLRAGDASRIAAGTDRMLALAFLANAAWEWVFPAGWFVPAQLLILAAFLAGLGAFVGLVRGSRELTTMERWVVVPLTGLYLGWVTAAMLVGALTTAVALGWVGGDSTANAVLGIVLLGSCLVIATTIVVYGTYGDLRLPVAYLGAVLWAFVAIIVGQWGESPLTAIATALVVVGLALVAARRWLAMGRGTLAGGIR